MDTVALVVLIFVIGFTGDRILRRLPAPAAKQHFNFELPDFWVHASTSEIYEEDFNVSFVDEWSVGRTFTLYGKVFAPEDGEEGFHPPKVGAHISIKIYPTADWYETSRIGRASVYQSGNCEVFISMQYQVANQLLQELRFKVERTISVGLKAEGQKDGYSRYGAYSFELSDPLS